MAFSTATNTVFSADLEIDSIFEDAMGEELEPVTIVTGSSTSKPLAGPLATVASLRIGETAHRLTSNLRSTEETGTGESTKIGPVTLLGEGMTVAEYDSQRQGKNVKNLEHFSRMNLPLISINREGMTTRKNHLKHTAAFNNYGITKLFKSFDEHDRRPIPFEDFPGRLDPVALVSAGNYVMQYMIITDLTRDLDQFVNPDDLNGVIEVFEIRNSFANTSVSDIELNRIKGSMSNENFYAVGQGASPIDNKYEIKQLKNSFFEDSQDILYGETTFSPKMGYKTSAGALGFEGAVADEQRERTPFDESSNDEKIKFQTRMREFLAESGFVGAIESENIIPDLGTRYRAASSGFIHHPNYGIISAERFLNTGTDSIAFSGMNKN